MSEQLKPCPFCGGEVLKTGGDDKVVGVWCLNCQCTGPNHYGGHEWNDRTDLSLAHAAVMIEKAAQVCDPEVPCTRENKPSRDADISELFAWEVGHLAQKDAAEIRALINTDAQAALDEYVRGKAEAERDRLKEALEAARGIVHKAQVSATMELLNMSDSNPIFAQVEAWRRRCVKSEQDIVAALGDDNG